LDYPVSKIDDEQTTAGPAMSSGSDGSGSSGAPAAPGAIGRFPVIRLLGHGGMGEVFLSRHPVTGVDVAVKRLKPHLADNAEAVRRFLAEARHMYHLNHPRLVRVMEVDSPPGGPYFVMPYMPAGSLASKLRPGEPAEADFTRRVAVDVAEAVAFAHSRGIIHRDLKPANVLLDEEGRAYLADFGLVGEFKTNDSVKDESLDVCEGTVPYMSPAVARGEAEDTRCDIYSFGVMLYEMLTGHLPYGPARSRQTITAGPPPGLLERNPHAPRGLATVAEACMARELRDRYAHMNDVLVDLRRVAGGKPPLGPHGAGAGERRWSAVLALIAILALVTATPIWFLRDRIWPRTVPLAPLGTRVEPSIPHEIDLLKKVAIPSDVFPPGTANWVNGQLVLTCGDKNPRTSLVLPSMPPGDYDLTIEFTRVSGSDGLDHILDYHGRGFVWTLAGKLDDTTTSFWWVGDQGFGDNPTTEKGNAVLKNGVKHVSVIRVRDGLVVPILDGKERKAWRPEFGELSFPRPGEIDDKWRGRLGLSILRSQWIIHSIRLVENPQ
jgi:serine/threonine protein kinase